MLYRSPVTKEFSKDGWLKVREIYFLASNLLFATTFRSLNENYCSKIMEALRESSSYHKQKMIFFNL